MMDNYEMCIWSRNYNDTFEQQIDRVYNSLIKMAQIQNLAPKYLTTVIKKMLLVLI